MIVLPYVGKLLSQISTRINRVMKNKLPYCNPQIVFQTKGKLIIFFTFKDIFYGKTLCHFKVTMCKHIGGSALT